jgi:hypothetical protein
MTIVSGFAGMRADHLAKVEAEAPAHLAPIVRLVRRGAVNFLFVPQYAGRFVVPPTRRPIVALIGDDLHEAYGPAAFHVDPLSQLISAACRVLIQVCEPTADLYGRAANTAAVYGRHAVLIETRLEQEAPWFEFVKSIAPAMSITLATVIDGTA